MLRLDYEQYDEAVAKMAIALQRAEDAEMRTMTGRAMVMLEALGADFDVSAMDDREDTVTDVWPQPCPKNEWCVLGDGHTAPCWDRLTESAVTAALEVGPKRRFHIGRRWM